MGKVKKVLKATGNIATGTVEKASKNNNLLLLLLIITLWIILFFNNSSNKSEENKKVIYKAVTKQYYGFGVKPEEQTDLISPLIDKVRKEGKI